MGIQKYNQIANLEEDPYVKLTEAYKLVINDCSEHQLLVDLLKYKQSRSKFYSETIIEVSKYLRLVGGRHLYDFLYHNLPVPSESTIKRHITKNDYLTEGKFNVDELQSFIEKYDLQNVPFIAAEDATRVKTGVSVILRKATMNEI